ncbi:MAG: hypothetical protein V2J55_12990, partial [Candidatus Competibacteraceae bacterium]|nr:hypothetical protein [Candidatus Competibacteraceae bacterium]
MLRVSRRVRKIPDPPDSPVENPVENLESFRPDVAWVLLGEPGAGKTTAFKMQAKASGGTYLRIEVFIHLDIDPDWRDKTLFLDGLDEVRVGNGSESTLLRAQRQLKRLGNPPFRIACRAADWYGSTDRAELEAASPNGKVSVLLLEPLNHEDIFTILQENHGFHNPHAFVEEAEKRGVAGLLDNPQTLELLVEAIGSDGGRWPKTRDETYQLACEKLAIEVNKRHRDKTRSVPLLVEKLLDAAGQLCAVQLLSDKTGFALDRANANEQFPELIDCVPPDPEMASQAIGSKLFRLEAEELVVPSHRTVAEYLAARWLGSRIDKDGLPLKRVLNLLLGSDGRVVAGLRGLFGWFALRSRKARPCLINADPLTVVIYGDVKPMPADDKRRILEGLRREAERYTAFLRSISMVHSVGALADAELSDDFMVILQSPERDEASQSFADCTIHILIHAGAQSKYAPTLLSIIRDDTRWPAVREDALKAWLKLIDNQQEAINLLNDITDGRVTDRDDEMAGMLLRHLYPAHLEPRELLRHLHARKSDLLGAYYLFWVHDLIESVPEAHLPMILDELTNHPESRTRRRPFDQMACALLTQAIAIYGDTIADNRLFAWLGIGVDENGFMTIKEHGHQVIADWLGARPERYKALLSLCYAACEKHQDPGPCIHIQSARLRFAPRPKDIGRWHLEQISQTDNAELAKKHLKEAVWSLIYEDGNFGFSIEHLEAWGVSNPERKHWLDSELFEEIPNWQTEEAQRKISRENKCIKERRQRTIWLIQHLSEIRSGVAHPNVMHELACIWTSSASGLIPGDTAKERFKHYCENNDEVLAAAEAGFRLCPERNDLPTVEEIINLNLKNRQYRICFPCLVGMGLRWQDGLREIERLPDETLRRMIAFRLTYGVGETPAWFIFLVRQRATLVAEVLIQYASATLKSSREYVDGIHPLEHNPEYKHVATLVVPRLLEAFPVRKRSGKLPYLKHLLKAALRYTSAELKLLLEKKLAMKGMDVAQKVYWYAAATLLDPNRNETDLWRYVGKSEVRATHLAEFLIDPHDKTALENELSAKMAGKMIELITPYAQIELPRGVHDVSRELYKGDVVRALINRLSSMGTPDAAQEINRLLDQPSLSKLKHLLQDARHRQALRQRESQFRFLSPREVAQVLANQAPTSVADLAALTLDHLDDIARELRQENDDGFRAFWNVETKKEPTQREENFCRDALLTRLRARLTPMSIDCQPEGDYANDKRADIRLSYRTEFELPI